MLNEYLWCVVVGGLFCFTLGFGMGANDVSNNFGTSVGSKAISLKRAIVIAGICELIGSVFLGASVTDSVRKGVFEPDAFGDMPDLLLMANMCALIAGTIWLLLASIYGLPVSATHSLIGALSGCGLAISSSAVNWRFIGIIVSTWLISPLMSACVSIIYYATLRALILRSDRSVTLGVRSLWALVLLISAACSIFFMFSNPLSFDSLSCEQEVEDEYGALIVVKAKPCKVSNWVEIHVAQAFGVGLGIGAILTLILTPLVYWNAFKQLKRFDVECENARTENAQPDRQHIRTDDKEDTLAISIESASSLPVSPKINPSSTQASLDEAEKIEVDAKTGCRVKYRQWSANMPWNQDLHEEAFAQNERAKAIARTAEHFDPRCETFFKTVQIISASLSCIIHGSNDVANAAAPYASVYSIYREGSFLTSVQVPMWILFLGGAAISVGLCFLGHTVIKKIGIELVHISPSRGFCIELAASTVMIIASFIGLPLSTTHVTIGAMLGVGLIDRRIDPSTKEILKERRYIGLNFSAINWHVMRRIASAWVGTLLICALLSYVLFSFAINAPTKLTSRYAPCSDPLWADAQCV